VSTSLPMKVDVGAKITTPNVKRNGLNAHFGAEVHCVASEPHATFLRIAVLDGLHEAAYMTAILGRLRHGYRIFQLRSSLGTRIELAYVFVRITFGSVANNQWGNLSQVTAGLRELNSQAHQRISELEEELNKLRTSKHGPEAELSRASMNRTVSRDSKTPKAPETPKTTQTQLVRDDLG